MDLCSDESIRNIFAEVMRLHFLRSYSLLEKTGVYPGQPPLLFLLNKQNGQSQKELSDKLRVKPATTNVMIKRMEKSELVERRQDEKDQRISRIFITEKGLEVCNTLIKIHEEIEKECFANFTNEEIILMRRFLMQIRDNLLDVCKDDKFGCCEKNKI